MCSNGQISNSHGNFTWATSKADLSDSGQDSLSQSSLEDIGFWFRHHFSHSDWFSWTPLNSTVVPMTQHKRKRTTKDLSLRAPQASYSVFSCHSLQCEYLHIPPLTSMSSYIFRGHLWQENRINEGLLPVLSCNSHKHISPSTRFVVNTPKPTRGGTRCTYNLPLFGD